MKQDANYDGLPIVAVIMSAYNGEKYLAEQIESLLSQKDVRTEIFIRDDGSSDSTRDIITKFGKEHDNIHADFGNNIGWVDSFYTELIAVKGFDYYAFCDQDDVWKPDKLITAVKTIRRIEEQHGKNFPVVWHSSLEFVNSNLELLFVRHMDKRVVSLESFLMWFQGRGCAMVFNAKSI